MMVSCDNSGKKIGEINTIIRSGEGVVITSTAYSGERVNGYVVGGQSSGIPIHLA
jgi:hypothetical protein